jgi:hypothetical protein
MAVIAAVASSARSSHEGPPFYPTCALGRKHTAIAGVHLLFLGRLQLANKSWAPYFSLMIGFP